MRRLLFALCAFSSACAGVPVGPTQTVTTYALPDWPASSAAAAPVAASSAPASAPFRAPPPEGYRTSDGVLGAPVAAVFTRDLPEGEAAVLVERYARADPGFAEKAAFVSNLGPSPETVRPVARRFAGREFTVYEGIEFESLTRRIPPSDPYRDRLGSTIQPPRLSFLEERRFPVGGEAYRFYRCRKEGAWGLLRSYRRLQTSGGDLARFRDRELGRAERGIVAACFGQAALMAMDTGAPTPDVAKPSMYRLRIMAREEWTYGASRKVEREAVVLVDFPEGYYALRLRAPRMAFAGEFAAFGAFVAGFESVPSR